MPKKSKDRDAALWEKPEMQALDKLTREILKVPKAELDRRLAEEEHPARRRKGESL
jgi:hypothetical protein